MPQTDWHRQPGTASKCRRKTGKDLKLKLLLAAILVTTVTAHVQAASLSDLAFLEGDWVSDRSGLVIGECWTDEKADVK